MIPWNNLDLIGVVNKIRPVQTPVVDRHFTRTRQAGSNTVQIDTVEGPEGIMVAISWDAESRKAARGTVSTQTITLPRFSEHDLVTAMDQMQYRAPGVVGGGEAFAALVASKLGRMRARIDRTKELLAVKALQGQVVDGDGNVIATYSVPSAVSVDFSTADVLDAFRAAKTAISRALGYAPRGLTAYCGPTAMSKVLNNSGLRDLVKAQAGVDLLTEGALRNAVGIDFVEVPWQYTDNQGSTQNFVPDDAILIAPADADFELVYGPCIGRGGRIVMQPYYSEAIELDDPPATKLRVESNPLPVVSRPDAIYRITAV